MASRERSGTKGLLPRALALALIALLGLASAALAAFPQDPPDDPAYAPAEQGGPETCQTKSGDGQQHYLFSFIPRCTPNATDAEGSAGMFVDQAWKRFTTGDSHTVIAYIEGGINWHDDPEELANKVFLNAGELPRPTTARRDGALSARDYADTKDRNGNGLVDPEDILVRFSDGRDDDGNGYVDDISGWDFYNDQNDPATLDSAYDHAIGQMKQAASETGRWLWRCRRRRPRSGRGPWTKPAIAAGSAFSARACERTDAGCSRSGKSKATDRTVALSSLYAGRKGVSSEAADLQHPGRQSRPHHPHAPAAPLIRVGPKRRPCRRNGPNP